MVRVDDVGQFVEEFRGRQGRTEPQIVDLWDLNVLRWGYVGGQAFL
jgi:hypothetical protein